jgi:hypothetical protein
MRFKKNILNYLCLLSMSGLLLFFSSCKDNPIIPKKNTPYVFDTARYNWKIDTIPELMRDVWGIDTNTIYFLSSFCLLKYNGANYQRIYFPSGIVGGSFGGVNELNLYIGCGDGYNNYKPLLLKYDGASFYEININDSSKGYNIMRIYSYSENETWIGTDKGRLLMYDGDSVHYYCTDTTYEVFPLLKKSENEFYVFADNSPYVIWHGGDVTVKIFNFSYGSWQLMYLHVYKFQGNEDVITVHRFNDEIFGLNTSGLYKFSSNEFVKILNINQFFPVFNIAGYSDKDFLIDGVVENDASFCLLNWNGNKWSKEKKLVGTGGFNSIRKIQDKYIAIFDEDVLGHPNVVYGIKK